MFDNIKEIINKRLCRDKKLFFHSVDIVETSLKTSICKRKEFLGIIQNSDSLEQLLPCIYDDIVAIENDLFLIRVNEKWGIFDAKNNCWCIELSIDKFMMYDIFGTVEVVKDGQRGLFSRQLRRLVIPIKFEQVTNTDRCEYLWVYLNGLYHFIKKSSGEFISLSNTIMAYDMETGIFALCNDGYIYAFSEEGYVDNVLFRRFVLENKGRGRFLNFKYHRIEITDLYGYILN